MGKPYNHNYHFKGSRDSAGTMICAGCREPIHSETQDWRDYMISCPVDDWRFVVHHRKCCSNDPAWQEIESRNAATASEYSAMLREFRAFVGKWQHREGWLHDVYEEVCND